MVGLRGIKHRCSPANTSLAFENISMSLITAANFEFCTSAHVRHSMNDLAVMKVYRRDPESPLSLSPSVPGREIYILPTLPEPQMRFP